MHRSETSSMLVEYLSGDVTVVDVDNGTQHRMTFASGALTGSESLPDSDRQAIADRLQKAINDLESTLASFASMTGEPS
jgi:hypothetical protein